MNIIIPDKTGISREYAWGDRRTNSVSLIVCLSS